MALSQKSQSRYRGAGPWQDGQFYVWDCYTSGITKPYGIEGTDWPRLNSMQEAEEQADILNNKRDDGIYALYRRYPEMVSWEGSAFTKAYEDGLKGENKPPESHGPELQAWEAGHDTSRLGPWS